MRPVKPPVLKRASNQSPEPAQGQAAAGEQEHDRAAGERPRDLALLAASSRPRSRAARRRRSAPPPPAPRTRGRRSARRSRAASRCRAAPRRRSGSVPAARAQRDGVDRDPEPLGLVGDRQRIAAVRGLAVGEQHDRARRPLAAGAAWARASPATWPARRRWPCRRWASSPPAARPRSRARSVVGLCTASARSSNTTPPTRTRSGTLSRNASPRRTRRDEPRRARRRSPASSPSGPWPARSSPARPAPRR